MSRITETIADSVRTSPLYSTASSAGLGSPGPVTSSKTAGITSAPSASRSRSDWALAARDSNFCWPPERPPVRPPMNIAAPITSRMFPMMDPTNEALTTSCRPSLSAKNAMISSGALPNVTLSRPPIPGPERAASSSVARPMSAAVGMTPAAAAKKMIGAAAWTTSSATATGISGTSR
jgi:hypothetical protein